MLKNTENQKWIVFAFDATTGLAKTGDAAQITANLRKDYGDAAAITDTTPTELEDGYYAFDLSQAETNADHLLLCPASSTANIVVIGCPAVIFTEPTGRKYPATLAAADVSGNVPAVIKDSDDIDFTPTQTEALYDALDAAMPSEPPTTAEIKTAIEAEGSSIASILAAVVSTAGEGAIAYPYVLTDDETSSPIAGVEVSVSSDVAGTVIVASGTTDINGSVTFNLNAGTYCFWREHPNYTFVDPDVEVVS